MKTALKKISCRAYLSLSIVVLLGIMVIPIQIAKAERSYYQTRVTLCYATCVYEEDLGDGRIKTIYVTVQGTRYDCISGGQPSCAPSGGCIVSCPIL